MTAKKNTATTDTPESKEAPSDVEPQPQTATAEGTAEPTDLAEDRDLDQQIAEAAAWVAKAIPWDWQAREEADKLMSVRRFAIEQAVAYHDNVGATELVKTARIIETYLLAPVEQPAPETPPAVS